MKTTDDIIKQRAKVLFYEDLSEKLKSMDWKIWNLVAMLELFVPKTGGALDGQARDKENEMHFLKRIIDDLEFNQELKEHARTELLRLERGSKFVRPLINLTERYQMSTEDKVDQKAKEDLFKLLDSIDWKLWEIYNMMKDNLPEHEEETVVKGKKYIRKRDE